MVRLLPMNKPVATISDLFPEFNEKQLIEAEEALDQYLMLVLRIYERLEAEGKLGEPGELRRE